MDLDTRQLRALVAVVDEGAFTDAAIALRTSQASVSRAVQRLESMLGTRLLARSTRHVETTAAGARVLLPARRILALAAQLEAAAASPQQTLVLGYAWSALGEHTLPVQRAWQDRGRGDLELVQSNTPSAGLLEGRCEVSVVRRQPADPRLASEVVGTERRYAALAADDPLARRDGIDLADLAGRTVAVDVATGTTTEDLWSVDARPAAFRSTHGMDEWLILIASGRAVGVTAEATAAQHARPGVVFLPVHDAPPVTVWLTWWREDRPAQLDTLIRLTRAAYDARSSP